MVNIQQHAGADEAVINLVSEKDHYKLIIQDNGKGFEPESIRRGNGLDNMEARCRENAGTLRIESQPDRGTTIEAVFPHKNQP